MLNRLLKFLYFGIGFRARYLFWRFVMRSSCGNIGRNAMIYEKVRIVLGNPRSINIGNDVRILRNVTISTSPRGKIHIGNNVHIGEGTIIYSDAEIRIGDNVIIGPHNIIVDFDHCYNDLHRPMIQQGHTCAPVRILDDVWISSHCSILKGITIGGGAIIGAGAVVTRNVPGYSIVGGVPARVIKTRKNT